MNYEQAVEGFLVLCGVSGASEAAQTVINVVNVIRAQAPEYGPEVEQKIIKFYLSLVSKVGAKVYQRKGITLPGYTPPATVPLSEMTDEQVIAMLRPYYTRYVETLGEAA